MSIAANSLTSVAVRASALFLMAYDKVQQDLLPTFAQTVPPNSRQLTQYFEWWDAFPLMREWVGERKTTKTFGSRIEVGIKTFERTFDYDLKAARLEGDQLLGITPEGLAGKLTDAFANGILIEAFRPLRENLITTYDNQNLIDTDHTHPDGVTFSNVWDLSNNSMSRSATGAPTAAEARAELEAAVSLLTQNRLRNVSLVEMTSPPLVVIVRSQGTWKGYNDLLTQDVISNTTNQYKGGFRLLRDYDPESGDEKKVDFILAEPNGPRPVIYCPFRNPDPVKTDISRVFWEEKVFYGTDADFGFAAGLPQSVVRVQE